MKRKYTKRKNNRFRKTVKKYKRGGGPSTTTATLVGKAENILAKEFTLLDQKKKDEFIKEIEKLIKDKDIQIIDNSVVGSRFNRYASYMKDSVEGAVEKLAEWLLPLSEKKTRKNTTKVGVYFYPSLIQSKLGADNTVPPKVKYGSILIKVNNKYADISSFFSSMFRETDDVLANMRRGLKYNVSQKPFHSEKFTINELLDENWKMGNSPAPPK